MEFRNSGEFLPVCSDLSMLYHAAQAERWIAYGFIEAEKGFRRIKGCQTIPNLVEKLRKPKPVQSAQEKAA